MLPSKNKQHISAIPFIMLIASFSYFIMILVSNESYENFILKELDSINGEFEEALVWLKLLKGGLLHSNKYSAYADSAYCGKRAIQPLMFSSGIPDKDKAFISSVVQAPNLLCSPDERLSKTYFVLKSGSIIDLENGQVWSPGESMSEEVLKNRPYIKSFENQNENGVYKITEPYIDLWTGSKVMTFSTTIQLDKELIGYLNYDIWYDQLIPSEYSDYFSIERYNNRNIKKNFSLNFNNLAPDLYLTYCADLLCIATFNSKMHQGKLLLSLASISISALLLVLTYYNKAKTINRKRMLKDPLTLLSNRKAFYELVQSPNYEHSPCITLAIVDIDDFKQVNDRFGHLYGDYVIKEVSHIISRTTRDCGEVFRFGGEEFLVLINTSDTSGAHIALNRTRSLIAEKVFISDGIATNLTVSIGACSWKPSMMNSSESLIHELSMADEQLYKVKNSGKNRVEVSIRQDHRLLTPSDEPEGNHV